MKPDSSSNYWLYEWIDEREIRKAADLRKPLRNPSAIDRLIELSEDRTGTVSGDTAMFDSPVIAGRRIDLSGHLGCDHFECIAPQIDILFGRTWHYFDTIIVDDPELGDPESDFGKFASDVEQRVNLLLHLRKIGANESVAFSRKVSGFCQYHFREFAESNRLGIDLVFDESAEDAMRIIKNSIRRNRDQWLRGKNQETC